MSGKAFVDTNVLVYAHDRDAGDRHRLAADLVRRLWRDRAGVLSTQVLQEVYVNVRRKPKRPLSRNEALRLIEDYLRWQVVANTPQSVTEAIRLEARFTISFWDALIVHAAQVSGAEILYTEDLNAGQSYGSVRVVNPFT
jgi:predicted nucleic acid-binding protein